ncbi:hypothetical protein O3M35_010853 [Rhynocoris fuscipes]|uniref:WD repeat-containing protein 79 n=1 Tax=Rhynocoris fuscipes TaxID=488301 RepID=A0AAW1D879_9HEMI
METEHSNIDKCTDENEEISTENAVVENNLIDNENKNISTDNILNGDNEVNKTENDVDEVKLPSEDVEMTENVQISSRDSNEVISATETQDDTLATNTGTLTFINYSFDNIFELTKSTKPFNVDTFLYGCKWSPDGTCLLTNCADYTIRLFDLPQNLYNKQIWNKNETLPELVPSLKMSEGGQIYDYDWYPFMSSWYPETCSFLTTSSKATIHLWDAYVAKILATYRGYNRFDETANAYSVKFSLNGEKIFSGYENEVKIFDTLRPGRDFVNIDTKHVAGQSGIISCIAENPSVPNMFAAGSYKKTIGLYLESGDSICLLSGQRSGITYLMWSQDGTCLYSGARKDNEIICWDIRNPGEVLCTMERTVNTNQRIYFDLSPDGRYLISGNTTGELTVWDLHDTIDESGKRNVAFQYRPHLDCANGISIHRQLPILATSSGQRHVPDITSDDEEDNHIFDTKKMMSKIENSIKLWWIGPVQTEPVD